MVELFFKTFIFYFIVIDPIGSTPIFLVVTEHLDAKEKLKKKSADELSKATGGMNLPFDLKFPF